MKPELHAAWSPPWQSALLPLAGSFAVTSALWLSRTNPVSFIQFLAAFALSVIPCWSYLRWKRSSREVLPLFALIAGVYWLYFAVPLFWGDRSALDWRSPRRVVGDEAITLSLLMVLLGLASLHAGMRAFRGRPLAPRRVPDLIPEPRSWSYLRAVLIGGAALALFQPAGAGGEGGRQVFLILQSTLPLAAFVVLFRRYLAGNAGTGDKILIIIFLCSRSILGVSSGWVGPVVTVGMVCVFAYMADRRGMPVLGLWLLLPYVVFFQAGKDDFRSQFWYRQVSASRVEKVEFWIHSSLRRWGEALDDPTGAGVTRLLSGVVNRTSLLTQCANVIEQTPSRVPFQNGRLYSYLAVTLVPRFVWPEKPSMNEANQFYQVAYGITPERNLGLVSIAMGTLTESYVNFGWPGVAGVMFGLGVLLGTFQRVFLTRNSGTIVGAMGIVITPQLLVVEFQLAQYLGGLVQHILLPLLVLLPVMHLRPIGHRAQGKAEWPIGMPPAARWRSSWN